MPSRAESSAGCSTMAATATDLTSAAAASDTPIARDRAPRVSTADFGNLSICVLLLEAGKSTAPLRYFSIVVRRWRPDCIAQYRPVATGLQLRCLQAGHFGTLFG